MIQKIKDRLVSWLLLSQKYMRADMRYIAKNASWVTMGQVVSSVLSLVLLVAFANLLSKESYGTYRYILSIAGILNIFALTGMNNAVARAVARGMDGALRPAVRYQLKWSSLMFAAFGVLSTYYGVRGDVVFSLSFLILGIFIPLTLTCNTYSAYLEGKRQFGLSNVLSILATVIYSIGILLALVCKPDVLWLIAVYAMTTFVPSFVFYLYIVRRFKPPIDPDIQETAEYARELTYLRVIDPLVAQIDKIVLAHFWGPAQLATYALSIAIPNRTMLFIKGWVGIGFPKFAGRTIAEINKVFYWRILQGIAIGIAATIAYVLLSPYLFMYVLPQYADGVFYSQLLSMIFVVAIPNRYVSLLLTAHRFTRILMIRTLIHSTFSVLLYIICGFLGGIMGLIAANLTIGVTGLLLNIILWRSVYRKDEASRTRSV